MDNVIVDRYYVMNPNTEDLLPTGRDLKPGMVVLLESTRLRQDPTEATTPGDKHLLLERNRWCEVSDIEVRGEEVFFVAKYADGEKRKRYYGLTNAYLVKLDSVPKQVDLVNLDIPSKTETPKEQQDRIVRDQLGAKDVYIPKAFVGR